MNLLWFFVFVFFFFSTITAGNLNSFRNDAAPLPPQRRQTGEKTEPRGCATGTGESSVLPSSFNDGDSSAGLKRAVWAWEGQYFFILLLRLIETRMETRT